METAHQSCSSISICHRIEDQAAGLDLPEGNHTQAQRRGQEPIDPYWEDVFCKDVDGYGTDMTAFARRTVLSSLLMGHSAILVRFPLNRAGTQSAG